MISGIAFGQDAVFVGCDEVGQLRVVGQQGLDALRCFRGQPYDDDRVGSGGEVICRKPMPVC